MNPQLGRRQREDQPTVAVVDETPAEDVSQNGPQCLRLGRVEQDVCADDRDPTILRLIHATMWPMPGWGVVPSIRVRDMREALAFYVGPLEFSVASGGEDDTHASITRGDARLMLETTADFYGDEYNAAIRERLGTPPAISLYIEASDLAGFQERLRAAGARIVDPLADRPWGQAEFTVEDNEGNWLSFWSVPGAP